MLEIQGTGKTQHTVQVQQNQEISAISCFDATMGVEKPLHILLAEDNKVNQLVATKLLSKFGYQADLAQNGKQVIQALKRKDYDVVLMDILMPEMDGAEATISIRESWPIESQPWIIAMTAHALEGNRERFINSGMDDYISKPLEVKILQAVLNRIPQQPRHYKWSKYVLQKPWEPTFHLFDKEE